MLIGDAAHGVSPAAGQGASLAIADALPNAAVLDPRTPGSVFATAIGRRRIATDHVRTTPTRHPAARPETTTRYLYSTGTG
ncbi:hypothetical protein FXW78_12615 [Rhodococcus opacus]|nr:hypothetical protein [Rhodococcus opacus]RZL80776.1 MAG: hypothetical protein EOP32_16270 [Rhodococcus sp. (in: high G+C Gram-positive bacteria)]